MQLNRLATDLEIAEQLTASMAQDASGFDSLTIAKNLEFVTTLIRNSRQVYEADLYEEKMDLVAEELEAEARENIQQDLRDLEQEIQ